MDKRKIDVDYIMSHKMGLDDTFQFHCKSCGKCCKQRADVLLTPYDVFRIARYLVRTPEDIIDRYCRVYDGPDSHLPIVNIRPNPPDNACPFLRNKKCMVHKDKPLVCAVFPLSRIYEYDTDAPFYVLQPDVHCGKSDRIYSVRQWMGALCSEESEREGKLWGDITASLSMKLHHIWSLMDSAQQKAILNLLFKILYLNYDVDKPFISQLENNAVGALLCGTLVLGLEDVPEWLSIPESLTPIGKYALLLGKTYHLYKKDLCVQRGIRLADLMVDNNLADENLIDFADFAEHEFAEAVFVKRLLSPVDFNIWLSLGDISALAQQTAVLAAASITDKRKDDIENDKHDERC